MKQFITLLLLLIGVTLSAQEYTPDLVGKAIFSQTGGGAGYWQVSGTFTDESGAYDGSTIQVNDVLYFTDGGNGFFLPITQVTSITPPSFVVRVSNTGITLISGVPTTIGAIYHPSTNLNLPYYVSGISNPDQQTLINYLVYKIDSLVGVPEITDFIGTYDVSPAVPASGETGETWRNSVGELYYSDGTSWYTDKEIKYSTSSLQGLSSGKYKIGIDTVGTDTIYVSNNGIFRRFSTSSTTNLDEAYNNFGSNPATINVDGSQGQGDLKITASNMASIILDNTGTGTIEIRNNASPKILVTSSGLVGLNSISTNSGVEIGSSLAKALVSVTSPTWTVGNAVTYLFTSSSTQSVTLPSPSSCPSRVYTLVNPAGIDKTVSSYESLSGATSTTLPSNSSLTIQSNGFQWVATSFTSSATVSTTDGLTIDFSLSGLDITAEVKTNSLDSSHIKLRGLALNDISPSGASLGQIIAFDGTNWVVGDDGGTTYYAGTGIYISNDTIYNTIVTFSGDVSGAYNNLQIQPNTIGATELQSTGVSAGTYPISANHVPIFVLDVDGRVTSISESPITGLIYTIGNPSTTPDLQAASISNDTLYLHYADDVTPGILVASGDVSPGGATAQSGLQVDGLKGRTISNDVPDDGDCYIWDTGTNKWVPGPCGSAGSIAMDNWRLPATYLKIPALGINANESVANYSFNTINNHLYYFSSNPYGSGGEYGGWLANGTSGDSVCVLAPYWVLIGDSQAEGHPSLHGRLHPGSNTFSAFYADQVGQLSYDLSVLTNMRFFNHGIGGQTSKQVWERWQRDVLAQSYDPSDGRGSRTLRANTKPQGVVVIAGINDIYQGSLNNTWHVTSNLENMAKSARDNGIQCVFLNCPGDEINTALQNRKVDSINVWMQSGILQSYGASVVDYNTWWRDPAYDDNSHAQALIVDDIHPSTAGYTNLANYIFNTAKLPVLDSVTIYTKLSPTAPVSGYSRPTTVTIQGSPYTLTGEKITVPIVNSRMTWDSVWFKIDASTNITGTSYSGFSHIIWHVRNDTAGLATRRPELYQGYQPNTSNVWTRASGVLSPSTVTDKVAIGLSTTSKVLEMRGTTNDATFDFAVTGLAGTTASLAVSNNGRVAINANSTPYNFGVYGNMIVQKTVSDYWFFDGSSSQMYGTQPTHRWQSTTVNTGGTGYTEMTVKFDGSYYYFQPASGSAGKNVPIRFDRKSGANVFAVDLDRNMIGYNAPVYQGPYIDFNKATRAMWIPSVHRDSFNIGGGYGGVFGYNNTDHLFQGVVNNTRHTFVTNVSTDTHTTNDVLTWNGTGWVSQAATGGTIGGSIASTQIAYGSGTNTITGNANFIYSGGNVGIGTPSPSAKLHIVGGYMQKTTSGTIGIYNINNPASDQVRGTWDYYVNADVTPDFFGKFGFKFEGGTNNAAKQFQIHISDASAPKMVVNGAGNVGIGTISPSARINVVGSGATSGTYTAAFHNSTGTNNALVVRDDGKVGIGTTSFPGSIKLAVNGQIGGGTYSASYLDFTGSTPEIRGNSGIGYYSATGSHIFYGASSGETLRITSAGSVGISNASPTRTLDVNGELRIRDLVTTTATQILVADNDGVVSSATLGSGLTLASGVLSVTGTPTDLTFSGASSPVTLNSNTGTDVTYTSGTGISLSATGTDLTINNTLKMREESFTATGGQTAFTIAYSAPAVSGTSVPLRVYRNGVRLFWVASAPSSTQFTYSGTTVTTASNTAGDIITIEYLN